MHRFATALVGLSLASVASAQLNVVIPNGYAAVEGGSSNAFPWGRGNLGLLHQCVYDSTHFTLQGITYPILIQGLRWRPNTNVALPALSYPTPCSVRLSTCPVDWNSTTTTFATNRGADETLCFQGPVSYGPQPAVVGPTPFGINIPLTTPFLYDPNLGDLNIECDLPIQPATIASVQLDVHATAGQANAARIYWSTGYTGYPGGVASGREANHAVVVQVDYVPASGLFAGFTANVTTGASPLAVNFTNSSFSSDPGGITSYAWDFDGDAVIDSTQANPSFVYANCGTYTVSLTVTDATHPPNTLTRTNYIRTDVVTANFTAQVVGPLLVQFTDTSTPTPTSWAWDFNGDAIVDSTAQNPAWVFAGSASQNVTLTASRLCGPTSSITKLVSPLQQLTTNLAGTTTTGTPTAMYFNLNVLNPLGVSISSLDWITATLSTPFTVDAYLKQGTHVGFETNPAAWTKVGTASGTSNPVSLQPSNAAFPQPLHLPQGSYGVSLRPIGITPRYLSGANTYANGDLSLTTGAAQSSSAGPFTGTPLTPRTWSGTIYYGTTNVTNLGGYGWFGQGCPSTLGITSVVNTNQPSLGNTLTTNLDNLPFGLAVMVIGLSNTLSGGVIPLPLDIGFLGAPGCSLRVSLDVTDTVVGVAPNGSWSLAIPNNPALIGFQLYNQAAAFDPAANAFGFALSHAYGIVLGN